MHALRQVMRRSLWVSSLGGVAFLAAACAQMPSAPSTTSNSGSNVVLNGRQQVPPVTTAATGSGTITVLMDRSVSGSVTTSGVAGTAAHIHMAAPGQNGPVIIPLNRTGDNVWSVPPGIRLNDTQYEAFKLGNLYVNVHSAANPNGEIRGQLAQ
jgi:xanthine/uracil/vitamin C permease (AzgA family)